MPRHAGFAAVASIKEETVNKVIATYFQQVQGPYFIPMPQTLTALGETITFAGILQMDAPTVELHANPTNLVITHFTFRTFLRASINNGPTKRWSLQFTVTASTALITQIQNNKLVLGISTAQTTFSPLQVQVLQGPALPPPILAALQSQTLANILTQAVKQLPNLTISPPLLATQYSKVVPGHFPKANFSVFEWFTINVAASRIVTRPLEQAISVGVDFAGITNGDPNQLIDLTKFHSGGAVYIRHGDVGLPILVRSSYPGGENIVLAFNHNVLTSIVASQVSPRVAGTPITDAIVLNSVRLAFSTFTKPLRGKEEGLDLHFNVTYKGFDINGDAYIQPYLQTYDGATATLKPDRWRMAVGYVNVDLPWTLEVLLVLAQVLLVLVNVLMWTFLTFNLKLIEAITTELLQDFQDAVDDAGNASVTAQGQLSGEVGDLPLPQSAWSAPLPGTNYPRWDGMLRHIALTSEVMDVGIATWINWNDVAALPAATITPTAWSATDRHPIPVALRLRQDLAKLAGTNLQLAWEVRRDDTGDVVMSSVVTYTPGTNGPLIDHHTEQLYTVQSFTVRCTATLTLGNQVGEIWSGEQKVAIEDNLDRSHSFVEWGPHWVYFKAPGSTPEAPLWWSHNRRSRIHRTAVAARCKMLQRKAILNAHEEKTWPKVAEVPFQYRDTLPFPWDEVPHHRAVLCEYCFFGGPDKTIAFPQHDWFTPPKPFLGGILHDG